MTNNTGATVIWVTLPTLSIICLSQYRFTSSRFQLKIQHHPRT